MTRRLATLLAVLLLAPSLGAPAALAQQSPFQGLPPAPQTQPTVTQSASDTTTLDDGFETWQGVLVVLAAVLLITGIALAIARNAREHAPVSETDETSGHSTPDAHRRAQEAKRKQRAKARAAKQARRRNR